MRERYADFFARHERVSAGPRGGARTAGRALRLEPRSGSALAASARSLDRDAEHAPTSVAAPRTAVDVHVADSLAALELDERSRRAARAIADLGVGRGLSRPARWRSRCRGSEVALVESQARKCAFHRAGCAQAAGSPTRASSARASRSGREGRRRARPRAGAGAGAAAASCSSTRRRCWSVGGSLVAWRGKRAPERGGARRSRWPRVAGPRAGRDPSRCSRSRAPHIVTCTCTSRSRETPARLPARRASRSVGAGRAAACGRRSRPSACRR